MMLLEHRTMWTTVRKSARRGSILILVLGVLAMMAVFAAVYLAIGIGDQRASQAVEVHQEQQRIAPVVAQHLADTIGRDRLATVWRTATDDARVVLKAYRETTDYPYTDYSSRSIPQLSNVPGARFDMLRFYPEGSQRVQWNGLPMSTPDPRVASDPYLAFPEPVFLGGPNERQFPADPTLWWLDNHDWAQISNFAPDGLFVNLFALRNNFDAESGIETYQVGSQQMWQLSYGLTLIKRTAAEGPLRSTRVDSNENHLTGLSVTPLDMRNTPYFWTMNQRNMYFPINQQFTMLDSNGDVAGWGSPAYPDYQYADADGDGFADSRWFELKDSTLVDRALNLLPNTGDYRIFIAARAVDLSGLVNVNTATDDSVAPTSQVPLGASPAEIDVRRLLEMQDAALSYGTNVGGLPAGPLSYTSISRPLNAGQATVEEPASDYSLYGYDIPNGTFAPIPLWLGAFSYDALHRSFGIRSDLWPSSPTATLSTTVRGFASAPGVPNFPGFGAGDASFELMPVSPFEFTYALESKNEDFNTLADMDHRAQVRADRYRLVGSVNAHHPEDRPEGEDTVSERFGTLRFGVPDQSELLTYWNINDPASTSRLESTIDGRYEDGPVASYLTARRFGPLRSNRSLAFERLGLDDTTPGAEFAIASGSDGKIDRDAMALRELSPRQRLTAMNGAADLTSQEPLLGVASRFGVRLRDQEAKPLFRSLAQNPDAAFQIYRRAMAPYSNLNVSWDFAGTANFERYRTLFYGYSGPDFALRSGGHLAVNLADEYDTDVSPTVATMALSEQTGLAMFDDPNWLPQNATRQERIWFPGWVNGTRLTIPDDAKNNSGSGQIESDAVNIHGIEPQPFIVEAMTINVHTDAPRLSGLPAGEPNGDRDFNPASCQPPPPGGPIPLDIPITIGGKLTSGDWIAGKTLWEANADHVMQVFAVKLHNPFNVPITLGNGVSGPLDINPQADDAGPRNFDYYLEFGGRYFKLARYLAPTPGNPRYQLAPVRLDPGATRVFYVLDQEDEFEIVRRWARYLNAYSGAGQAISFNDIEDWLAAQFDLEKLDGSNKPVWIRRFNPETGLIINARDSIEADPDEAARTTNPTYTYDDLWEFPPDRDGNGDSRPDYTIPSVDSGATNADRRQPDWQTVRLWKKFSPSDVNREDETRWDQGFQDTDNWVENDILVDRLREPDPITFTPPNGSTQPAADNRIGYLDSRPQFRGGYGGAGPAVTNTIGCDQTLNENIGGFPNDNTGWTLAFHSFIRRAGFENDWAAREADNEERLRRGALPMWCIEALDTSAEHTLNTKGEEMPSGNLSRSDFTFSEPWAFKKFKEFMDENDPVEETFPQTPNEWDGPTGSEWPGNFAVNQNRFGDYMYGKNYAPNTARPFGAGYFFPELHVRNDKFEVDPGGSADKIDVSRVTDILTPMAIGPEYDPFAMGSIGDPFVGDLATPTSREPGRYLTLSEALALALGFEAQIDVVNNSSGDSGPDGTIDDTVYNRYMWFDLDKRLPADSPGTAASGDWEYAFDCGHLWLDKFVPFVDMTVFFDPMTGAQILFDPTQDFAMGERVTPAVKLLDSVQTTTDANAETILGRAIPGRVNINTASVATLRTIGMLSPSTMFDPFGVPENWAWRMANQYGNVPADMNGILGPGNDFDTQYQAQRDFVDWTHDELGLPDLSLIDIAPTLVSYRDRTNQIEYRYSSWPSDTFAPVLDPSLPSGFVPNNDPLASPFASFGTLGQVEINNRRDDVGRQSLTGIAALRETPGFSSPGEVVAAKIRGNLEKVFRPTSLPYLAEDVAPNQLDYLGKDKIAANPLPLKSYRTPDSMAPVAFSTTLEGRLYAAFDPFSSTTTYDAQKTYLSDEIGNEYDEQLVLTSQLMNLVTTRSDLFAVWFIVRGYTEADVSNLRGDSTDLTAGAQADPMLPSLERRYLMIIDRSKVGTWVDRNGDGVQDEESEIVTQPEIVLLREVPM